MIKGFALIVALLTLLATQTTSTVWDDWNVYTSNNNSTVHAISIPATPANFTRYANTSDYSSRKNQYRYKYNYVVSGIECNIYCGPRSFLIKDSGSGNYICQRDQSSQFWGGQSGYGTQCIPDVDLNFVCSEVVNDLGNVGACDMSVYTNHAFYTNYECCYDN